jgi:hypothetical protein
MTDLPTHWVIPVHHSYSYYLADGGVVPTFTTYIVWNPVLSAFHTPSYESNTLYYANGAGVFLYQVDQVSFDPVQYYPGYTLPGASYTSVTIAGQDVNEVTSNYTALDGQMPGDYLARLQDFYNGTGPDPALTPPPPPILSISDAAPVQEGDKGALTPINFILTLNQPAPVDFTVNVAFQTGQPLRYVNAVAGVDWITKIVDGLPLTELNSTVTFHRTETQATCTVQAVGDDLIEPHEFLTATIVGVSDFTIGISPTKSSGQATIRNDDGNLWDNVVVNGLSPLDPALQDLLRQDIQAAVGRIEQALDGRVPSLKIEVAFQDTPNALAQTETVSSNSIVLANGTKIQLPNALYKKVFPSNAPPTAADMVVELDLNKVINFYSGKHPLPGGASGIDVTTLMTHEILHGLGFGSTVNTDAGESPWIFLTLNTGGFFNGSQPIDKHVKLADDSQHLDDFSDLMGNGLLEPAPISDLDIAILNDLGWGPSRPSWLDSQIAGPNQPPPKGTSANMILRDGTKGNYEIYNIGNNAILAGYPLGQVGVNWQSVGVGSFNNSGVAGNAGFAGAANNTDMVLRDSTSGAFEVYNISDNNIINAASLGAVGLNWQFGGFGDFSSRPGETDMILRNTGNGALEVYDISNNALVSAYSMGAVGLDWAVAGFGDFSSRPNETDMIMRNANTGALEVYDIANNALMSAYSMGAVGLDWQVAGFGNFSSRANETDMIMRNSNTGALEVYNIANNALMSAYSMGAVGLDWQVVGFGNFSGNVNETDMILRNSNTGALEVYDIANNGLTAAYPIGAVGLNWEVGGIASNSLGASSGSSDVDQLVQAMAGFGGSNGVADGLNAAALSAADISQQSLLATPQHA